jgi:hypothetical protein
VAFVALAALDDAVVGGQSAPVLALVRGEDAGAAAERAGAVEGGEEGGTDEGGAVDDTAEGLAEGGVSLECEYLVAFHGPPPPARKAPGNILYYQNIHGVRMGVKGERTLTPPSPKGRGSKMPAV